MKQLCLTSTDTLLLRQLYTDCKIRFKPGKGGKYGYCHPCLERRRANRKRIRKAHALREQALRAGQ